MKRVEAILSSRQGTKPHLCVKYKCPICDTLQHEKPPTKGQYDRTVINPYMRICQGQTYEVNITIDRSDEGNCAMEDPI